MDDDCAGRRAPGDAVSRCVHVAGRATAVVPPEGWHLMPFEPAGQLVRCGDALVVAHDARGSWSADGLRHWSTGHPLVPVVVIEGSAAIPPSCEGWLRVTHPSAVGAVLGEVAADPLGLPGFGAHHVGAPPCDATTLATAALRLLFGRGSCAPDLSTAAAMLGATSSTLAHAMRREVGVTWREARCLRWLALLLYVRLWTAGSLTEAARAVGLSARTARRLVRRAGLGGRATSPPNRDSVRAMLVAERRRFLRRPSGHGLSLATTSGTRRDASAHRHWSPDHGGTTSVPEHPVPASTARPLSRRR